MFCRLILAVFLAVAAAFAQASAPPPQKDSAAEKLRKQTWQKINSYGELLSGLTETPARVRGLARLGSIVCRQDALFARLLFERAYAALRVGEETGEIKGGTRSFLISRVNQCDTVAAQRMAREKPAARGEQDVDSAGYMHLRTAFDALPESPERAAEFAAKAIEGNLTGVGMQHFATWLHELRSKDEEAANRLFLEAVQQMVARPVLNVNDLIALGLYPFTSPAMARDGMTDGLVMSFSAGVPMTNVSAVRAGTSPEIARAYLDAAITALTRPVDDPQQKAVYHAAALQLLPHAQQFGLDRAILLDATMRALREQIPPDPRRDLNRNSLDDTKNADGIESEKQIDELPGADERDERRLTLASSLIFRKQFGRAREVAGKISDTELRQAVLAQVDFGDGADALRQKDLARAVGRAEALPPGAERALLLLGVAAAEIKRDPQSGSARVFEALESIRTVGDERRGWLMLSAAGVQAKINLKSAVNTFSHALIALNRDYSGKAAGPVPTQPRPYTAEIRKGKSSRRFYLVVPEVPSYDFSAVLPAFAADDNAFVHVEASVRNLVPEDLLAQALPLMAREMLKKLK